MQIGYDNLWRNEYHKLNEKAVANRTEEFGVTEMEEWRDWCVSKIERKGQPRELLANRESEKTSIEHADIFRLTDVDVVVQAFKNNAV